MFYRSYISLLLLIRPDLLFECLFQYPWYGDILKTWVDEAGLSSSDHILELGCGTGSLTRYMHKKRYNVIGFDKSKKMLNLAREKHHQNIYYQGDASALPFSNDNFDVILAASFINVIKEPEVILQEIKRVLKPSGKVLFFFPNDQMTLSNVHKYIEQKEYSPYSKTLFYTWARRSPKKSIKEITTLIQSSGFKLISYHSYLNGMASSIGFQNVKNSM